MDQSIYIENGFKNRDHYLQCLAEDHGVPLSIVLSLADLLGPDEDFDGLVTSLLDYSWCRQIKNIYQL